MDRSIIEQAAKELFFSKEAADYLGISTQRLNQLVHSGQLKPIKKTTAGALFFRGDLDERNKYKDTIGKEIKHLGSQSRLELESPFMREVVNYFTIQSFFKNSDKKTVPIFEELSKQVDVTLSMEFISNDISKLLKLNKYEIEKKYTFIKNSFEKLYDSDYVIKKGMKEYPELLAMTDEAPPYLFLRGDISLLKENIVSVVGSRAASEEGKSKAYRLSKLLGKSGIVVASGLARGIDTAAHCASIENNYKTIAVLGTPVTKVYPKENVELQNLISKYGLLVSQFPPSSPVQRWHFPMRNAIMSGISLATAIVEAGETSGALKQADYALKQNRLVFIPQSALDNDSITWPKKYIQRKGARSFSKLDELLGMLKKAEIILEKTTQVSLFSEGAERIYVHNLK